MCAKANLGKGDSGDALGKIAMTKVGCMPQQVFFFDGSRCTGCKTCMFACKDYHDLSVGESYRKVYECVGGATQKDDDGLVSTCFCYSVSLACNHCIKPVCVEVCPTEAMHKDVETGLVSVDAKKCVGCGYCHLSCPYDAPQVNRSKGHSVKCDGCLARVVEGEKPICVEACPCRALDFGLVEDMAKRGERANIAPLPDPERTMPCLFVKASDDARPFSAKEVEIANVAEVRRSRDSAHDA